MQQIRIFGLLVGVFAFVTTLGADDSTKPNVLFIAVDDLNDWVGCMGGHEDAQTPNIDRLAARGVLFTNAHCAAPLCNPSRASVLTGMRPTTSGVHGNQQDWRKSPHLKGKQTLPEYFRNHGYWTGAAGKIFHANHGCECGALNGGHGGLRGFNHPPSWSERHPSQDRQLSPEAVPTGRNFNGLDIWHWDWGAIEADDSETIDGKSVAWAESQLAKSRDKPFFLAVGIYRPHGPWYAPKKDYDAFTRKSISLPKLLKDDLSDVPKIATGYTRSFQGNLHRRILEKHLYVDAVHAYLANIHFAERMVGRVLQALEKSPHADNTIVCLWSDHGWHLGEKQKWHKSTLWEQATRVPLIISAPGVGEAGQRVQSPASLIDLFPTLVELCGLPTREDLDGESLVPQLRNPQAKRTTPAITTLGGKHHSVRTDRWRYTRYADGSEELYDHENDPNEWKNLATDTRANAKIKKLAKWIPTRTNSYVVLGDDSSERGFRPIFNGYDFTSWEAHEGWKIEKETLQTDGKKSLTWKGSKLADFELRFQIRNSKETPDAYAEIMLRSNDSNEGGYLATIGDAIQSGVSFQQDRRVRADWGNSVTLSHEGEERLPLPDFKRPNELTDKWIDVAIVANQQRIVVRVNEKVCAVLEDRVNNKRNKTGYISLAAKAGNVEFRDLRVKQFWPSNK